jgi:hypothetical protein
MAVLADIKWGSYGKYEGPFYRGKFPYKPPAEPTENEKVLAIVAATEGRTDAINMYDGQVMSSGPIQVVERAQYSVSAMLGAVREKTADHVDKCLEPALRLSNAYFARNARQRWRFFFRDDRGEVDREDEQRELMHLDSNGQKGTWEADDADHASLWAACVASVFEDERARAAQAEWLVPRLRRYAFRQSKNFIDKASELGTPESLCFVAAYLTFAINNPTRANKHLLIGDKGTKQKRFSKGWLIEILKELTFGPHISIYPHRYDAIRAHLEKHYGVDLPDFAKELEDWRVVTLHDHFFDTTEVQEALILLGHDLGPAGADGVYGDKTRKAVWTFEQLHKVEEPDGMMDPGTAKLLEQELYARGIELLG